MIGPVRHNPSTVVVLAGPVPEKVLAAVGQSLNVVLVRPDEAPPGGGTPTEAATGALRRASGISAPYVLVAADPLAGLAAAWQAMWQIGPLARGADEFELRAAEVLGAWRAKRFELPDYYLVLAADGAPDGSGALADFYLGPLRAVRPNRVSVASGTEPAAQAAALRSELGALRHGPWWPSLEEIVRSARGFYPGALAESPSSGQATLLS
jgi:hypothetical protein